MRVSRCWQLQRDGRHRWCLRIDTDQRVIALYPGRVEVARRWLTREAAIQACHAIYGCVDPRSCMACQRKPGLA